MLLIQSKFKAVEEHCKLRFYKHFSNCFKMLATVAAEYLCKLYTARQLTSFFKHWAVTICQHFGSC